MKEASQTLRTFSFKTISVRLRLPELPAVPREAGAAPFPYWAKLWPSAIALSHYMASHPELIAGKKVLELAAGLGLPGLVAASLARDVTISDYMPEAVAHIRSSVRLNGLKNVHVARIDWTALAPDLSAELLLMSDVNYEPEAFEGLYEVLLRFLKQGTTILLATPQRLMAKSFIERLLLYCVAQEEQPISLNEEVTYISVFVLSAMQPFD